MSFNFSCTLRFFPVSLLKASLPPALCCMLVFFQHCSIKAGLRESPALPRKGILFRVIKARSEIRAFYCDLLNHRGLDFSRRTQRTSVHVLFPVVHPSLVFQRNWKSALSWTGNVRFGQLWHLCHVQLCVCGRGCSDGFTVFARAAR